MAQHVGEAFVRPMLQRDREALLALALPLFDEYRREFGLTHWYFIDPDRRVLLRVHQPMRSGDEVLRGKWRAFLVEDDARTLETEP